MSFFPGVRSKPRVFQVERGPKPTPQSHVGDSWVESHFCSSAVKHLVRQRTDIYSKWFGRTMVRVWFSGSHVALTGGRNSGLWCRFCQTGRGMLGQALGLFLNEWGRRDGPFHSETVGGERVSPAPISSTLAFKAALSREAQSPVCWNRKGQDSIGF